ncbi:MAG: hypothetical protein K1060chlam1_00944 [Candidatus Anoxychlamydiales bacterium]|nr:hypothetical protein [Candidatus Anoxychlamydiales bacterium]
MNDKIMAEKRPFYGRKEELFVLHQEYKKSTSSLIVIRGRRRIGKSRLIEQFSQNLNIVSFTGLPPEPKTTAEMQKKEFAYQMSKNLNMPEIKTDNWSELFLHLAKATSKGQALIVFDEISWMGSKDSIFLGKLKIAWDTEFSKNPKLMLILCGSVSSWIEKNILSQTGFLGRISIDLVLEQMPLCDCVKFWKSLKKRVSAYEIFKILSITGGVPKYLEEIIPEESAEDNIQRLCFKPRGILYREFDQIFSDLFTKRNETYRKIVIELINGSKSLDQICESIKYQKGGSISKYLNDLEAAGFVSVDWTWNFANKKISNLRKFRLSDNYTRFYLKYILPQKEIILQKNFVRESFMMLPNWSTIMGFQFENLVFANRLSLYNCLKINPADVLIANPYFQRKTSRNSGCQIDFLIQTRYHSLYVVEMKFSKSKIEPSCINEVDKKISSLTVPKRFSIRRVLVHVNGVQDSVEESGFFDYIVDFSSLLQL